MFLCAAGGLFMPVLWHASSGRDFRLQAAIMAVLMAGCAVAFRRGRRWHLLEFILSLVVVEVLMLAIIAHFSGFTGRELFHWFNLNWLGGMSAFVALPWLAGLGVGSDWLRRSEAFNKKENRHALST